MRSIDKVLYGVATTFIMLSLSSSPLLAAVSIQDARNIYKLLIKRNQLRAPPLIISTAKNPYIMIGPNGFLYDTVTVPNAWTEMDKIVITQAALQLENKAEIAHTLGHELTHYQFSDPSDYFKAKGTFMEDRADYYGAIYAEKIGYSKCEQAQLYLLYFRMYGNEGDSNDPHSPNLARYHNLCSK